jgi:PhzF family phenazine biosynthesis protein
MEVDLCGHATLGAAHILYELHPDHSRALSFGSRSGMLSVSQSDGRLWLNFPTDTLERADPLVEAVTEALGRRALEVYRGREDLLAVLEDEQVIRDLAPDLAGISRLPCRGLIAAAKGGAVDFVSRFFGPQCGVPEDPVTGSAHTTLTPYWAKRLGKSELTARQLSARGGVLWCRDRGQRTEIGGEAVTYLRGEIIL